MANSKKHKKDDKAFQSNFKTALTGPAGPKTDVYYDKHMKGYVPGKGKA
jgi:hypothetical protein